jgi:hypothetical protein
MIINLKNNYVDYLTIGLVFSLNIIWLIPNTIALRNILIYLAVILLVYSSLKKNIKIKDWAPIIFITSILAWLLIHLIFFGIEKQNQWSEYLSTWTRSLLGFFIGLGTALLLSKKDNMWCKKYLYLSGTILFTGNFIFYSIVSGKIYLSGMYDPLFKSKIRLMLACFPGMIYLLSNTIKKTKGFANLVNISGILLFYVLIFLVSSTRNGLIIVFIIGSSIYLILLFQAKKLSILLSITAITLTTLYFAWSNIFYSLNDFISAYQNYNKNNLWMGKIFDSETILYSNLSNYIRISHFIAGMELVINSPLGYGLMEGSFPKLGSIYWGDSFQYELKGTHSGLMDLALAYGLPIIIILIIYKVKLIFNGIKTKNIYTLTGVVILFLVLLLSESGSKQSIEYIFFLLGLISNKNEK